MSILLLFRAPVSIMRSATAYACFGAMQMALDELSRRFSGLIRWRSIPSIRRRLSFSIRLVISNVSYNGGDNLERLDWDNNATIRTDIPWLANTCRHIMSCGGDLPSIRWFQMS